MADYEAMTEEQLEKLCTSRTETISESERHFTIGEERQEVGGWLAAIRYPDGAVDRSEWNVERKMALVHLLQALDLDDD